jgi:hypothetical protein
MERFHRGQRLVHERAPRLAWKRRRSDDLPKRAPLEQLEHLIRAVLRIDAGIDETHPALVRNPRRCGHDRFHITQRQSHRNFAAALLIARAKNAGLAAGAERREQNVAVGDARRDHARLQSCDSMCCSLVRSGLGCAGSGADASSCFDVAMYRSKRDESLPKSRVTSNQFR